MQLKDRIRRDQPRCVFCAGLRPTETIEHIPSRIIFEGKHRPKGLEFGACKQCNSSTRKEELVVALMSRVYPDSTSRIGRQELRKLMRSAERNNPGLLAELYADQLESLKLYEEHIHKLPTWKFLRVDGLIVGGAVEKFLAKLGLALHFETTGRIVPVAGGVLVSWYSNLDSFVGRIPEELLKVVGPGKTLRAGSFEVSKQFRYASVASDDLTLSGHIAVFRESFSAQMLVMEDVSQHPLAPNEFLYRPGFL